MSDSPLRVAVAEDDPDTLRFLREALPRVGCEVVAAAPGGLALLESLARARPDLLITDLRMPDMDGLELARQVNRDGLVPVILLTAHSDEETIARANAPYILAYLIKPVGESDLRAAIPLAMRQYRQLRQLEAEADDLRQVLADRKVIERAKGALMRRLRIDEDDAFRRLRMLASSKSRKLIEVSRDVIAAEEVFQALESVPERRPAVSDRE